ncbi:MAG TPA: riboflavin synthase [Verrucomicrobiota bacterium]|nr:riboflavin synthase [Verrucomicrobiota bacterium]HNT14119.1 riboflavin synthase [Verrucomicrobiota bacterium]
MFTGIIQQTGVIETIAPAPKAIRLVLRVPRGMQGARLGASVAVNGCCLTVVQHTPCGPGRRLHFDVLRESWRRTNLQFAQSGDIVNLERPLRAGDELGGHFVTGHVDGLGKVRSWKKSGTDQLLSISAPSNLMRYVVLKGSIAVDGISLTVAGVTKTQFQIWIIPHTYEITTLRARQPGDYVNLEVDMLGKYVERFLARPRDGDGGRGRTNKRTGQFIRSSA